MPNQVFDEQTMKQPAGRILVNLKPRFSGHASKTPLGDDTIGLCQVLKTAHGWVACHEGECAGS